MMMQVAFLERSVRLLQVDLGRKRILLKHFTGSLRSNLEGAEVCIHYLPIRMEMCKGYESYRSLIFRSLQAALLKLHTVKTATRVNLNWPNLLWNVSWRGYM